MKRHSSNIILSLALVGFLLILAAGCAQTADPPADPTAAPTLTPTPDPAVILREAGEAMQALETVRFEMARSGAPVFFDPETQLIFNSAVGQYAAPDRTRAVVKVQGPGIVLEVNMIAIGEDQWLTNPLTRRWEKLPPGWGFNPAALFDPELGWEPILREDVTVLEGPIELNFNGRPHYQFRVTAVGDRLPTITAGLVQDNAIELTIWLERQSRLISQMQFETGGENGGEPSQWALIFSEFNEPVTINPPN